MEVKKLLISFTGNRAELFEQFRKWSIESKNSMNQTVISLIENHLNKINKKNKLQK